MMVMKKNSFLSEHELESMGFASLGENVLISKNASFYGVENISIGSDVRIDDFCILSGKIAILDNVHISAAVLLYGGEASITIGNHVSVSSRSAIYAITDDFSGQYLVGPMEPEHLRNVKSAPVVLKDFSLIGTGTTILPGITVGEGAAVGAMSLVKNDLAPWNLYVGIPCKKIKNRSKDMVKKAKR